jgi:hypothetical protein
MPMSGGTAVPARSHFPKRPCYKINPPTGIHPKIGDS